MDVLWEGTTLSGQVVAVRSREEIESAIDALTPADWVRLEKIAYLIARRYAHISRVEPQDLRQEALIRALDTRNCPTNVDIIRFLAEAMRSIAHGELEKTQSRPVLVSANSSDARLTAFLNYPDSSVNIEEEIISKQDVAAFRHGILSLFDNDPQACDIVDGRMAGMSAEELRELTGLGATAYDSKCRLIRRRINKAYPGGWKP